MGVVALLAGILGAGGVLPGWGAPPVETDDAISKPKQRTQQRRRERQGQRPWIEVPELTPEAALPLIGESGVVIIDVTCRENAAKYDERIPGAIWRDCTKVEQWADHYKGAGKILVYCA